MINAYHLIWIVPLISVFTIFLFACSTVSKDKNNDIDKGEVTPTMTFLNLYTDVFKNNYDVFMEKTGGLITIIQPDNQLTYIPILDEEDLSKYFDYKYLEMTVLQNKIEIILEKF